MANERAERSGWEWFTPRGGIGGRGFADERIGWVCGVGGMGVVVCVCVHVCVCVRRLAGMVRRH